MLHRADAVPRAAAQEPRAAAAAEGGVVRRRQQGGAARGRARAGLRLAQAGPGALRGRRRALPHTRVLDLPVPRRETLPIRIRQVCP